MGEITGADLSRRVLDSQSGISARLIVLRYPHRPSSTAALCNHILLASIMYCLAHERLFALIFFILYWIFKCSFQSTLWILIIPHGHI
jgi:hypothetical protein